MYCSIITNYESLWYGQPSDDELTNLRPLSRGVYAKTDLAAGQTLTNDLVELRRPLLVSAGPPSAANGKACR